jgi:hypothetical protein
MRKYFFSIPLFLAVVCHLSASTLDQIPVFTATSATASWSSSVVFSIFTGPSLRVQGEGSFLRGPVFFAVGAPVIEGCAPVAPDCMFDLQVLRGPGPIAPCCMGDAGIANPIPSSVLVPSTPNPTLTFPVHLRGEYDQCSTFQPECQPFVGHVNVDLPGELTIFLSGPYPPGAGGGPPFEFDYFREAQFISTPIPESSSFILMLIGSAGVALAMIPWNRKPLAG